MDTRTPAPGQSLALATLGMLGALTAGAGLWSALTGPPIAVVQLHDAADNTHAAPSLVLNSDTTISVSFSGALVAQGDSDVIRETAVYQAPNSEFVKASVTSTISGVSKQSQIQWTQIGSSCWHVTTCQSMSTNDSNDIGKELDAASSVSDRGGPIT